MPLRQMGEAVDLRRAIPDLKQRLGPNAYDDALRERLQAVAGIGNQANEFSAQQAYKRQQTAIQKRLQSLQEQQSNWAGGGGGSGPGNGKTSNYNGKYWSIVNGKPTFGYGATYKNGGKHHGLDFALPAGTQFYAPMGGKIITQGWDKGGFGNHIRVQFDNGTYGIFGHLSKFIEGLKAGSVFKGGQGLGFVGSTGNSTGNHLHFETRYDLYDRNTSFDPSSWFGW